MKTIRSELLLTELNKLLYLYGDEPDYSWDYRRGIHYAINTVELLSEDNDAEWKQGKYVYSCSNCGYMVETPSPYCPNCGHHMKGEYK